MKGQYCDELYQFCVEKDFDANWFYTLLAKKNNTIMGRKTTTDDLRDTYLVATRMLEKRLYGKWRSKKKRIKQLPIIETSFGGSIHLHILAKLDDIKEVKITGMPGDSYSWHMKDVWKRMQICSKVGNFDSVGRENFDTEGNWSKSVYNLEGLVEYVSKQINDERGLDICYDLFEI